MSKRKLKDKMISKERKRVFMVNFDEVKVKSHLNKKTIPASFIVFKIYVRKSLSYQSIILNRL